NSAFVAEIHNRGLHENRLVEDHLGYEGLWDVEQVANRLLDSVNDRNSIAVAALFKNRQIHRSLSIHPDNIRLNGGCIFRMAHIRHHQFRIAFGFKRQPVDFFRGGKLAIGVDVVVLGAYAHVTGRQNRVCIVNCAYNIHQAQLMSLKLYRINIDLDLPVLAAKRLWYGCAGYICDLITNRELAKIVQLGFIQSLAFQCDEANRQTRSIEFEHNWWQSAGWQSPQLGHRQIRDSAYSRIWISTRLKVNLNKAHSG